MLIFLAVKAGEFIPSNSMSFLFTRSQLLQITKITIHFPCYFADVPILKGHTAEIISLSFNSSGTHLITGSFDNTVMVWDVNTGKRVYTLVGHQAEISSAQFNFDCSLIATGSMDKTCKLWDFTRG